MATNETPMNKKSELWFITINPPKEKPTREVLEGYLKATKSYFNQGFYASAIHDQDKEEDGTPKTIHCHIYIETPLKPTKKAIIGELVELLGINSNQVGINASNNSFLPVQYLIHKNDQDKHQYNKAIIETNNLVELDTRIGQTYEKPPTQAEQLLKIDTLHQLVDTIGLEGARKYRGLWEGLKQEAKSNYKDVNIELVEAYKTIEELEAEIDRLNRVISSYENLNKY